MQMLVSGANGYAMAALLLACLGPSSSTWLLVGVMALGALAGTLLPLRSPGPWVYQVASIVWLGVLPAWGFWINSTLDPCTDACESTYQALDAPGLYVVAGSYALALAAWALHRWRRGPRHPGVEALLITALVQGLITCAVLVVQFGPVAPMGLVFAPVGLPLVAPTIAAFTLAIAAMQRLAALGRRDQAVASFTLATSLGIWTLATWFVGPWLGAFTQTCGWTLSHMRPPDADCHYLCTVAAQGSPTLVRPLRMGRRRGRPIVVNRQLAVANAFEDLLHERWPRFGRFARRTYDLLAKDLSRWLCYRWLANGMYLAMLPAQVGFELFLLAFDPADPEERIDRMYR